MKAGAGKSEITLAEDYLTIENFTVIHRALNARAVIMESEAVFVCISLELTSLPEEEIENIRTRVKEYFGQKEVCIWICVTHTFSAPHLLPDRILEDEEKICHKKRYREALKEAAAEAVGTALQSMQPVTIGFETGFCDVNQNRDVELQDGWWIGEGGLGLVDHTVSVVRLNREDGTPLAVLFHYGIQSSVLDGSELSAGGKAVTPDLAGVASDYVEKNYKESKTVGLFLLGAAGDQCPIEKTVKETFVRGERVRIDRHEEGFGLCEDLGEKLGKEVCRVSEQTRCYDLLHPIQYDSIRFPAPGKEMERDLKRICPVRNMEYISAPDQEVEVEAVVIGQFVLTGVQPELNCCSAVAVGTGSPFQNTLVCTMVNGACKYMADRRSYDHFTYEAMNSPFGRGAAELLVEKTLELLKRLREKRFQ